MAPSGGKRFRGRGVVWASAAAVLVLAMAGLGAARASSPPHTEGVGAPYGPMKFVVVGLVSKTVDIDPAGVSAGDYTVTAAGLSQGGHKAGSFYTHCVVVDTDLYQRQLCSLVVSLTNPPLVGDLTAEGEIPAFPPPGATSTSPTLAVTGGTGKLVGAAGEVTTEFGFYDEIDIFLTRA